MSNIMTYQGKLQIGDIVTHRHHLPTQRYVVIGFTEMTGTNATHNRNAGETHWIDVAKEGETTEDDGYREHDLTVVRQAVNIKLDDDLFNI